MVSYLIPVIGSPQTWHLFLFDYLTRPKGSPCTFKGQNQVVSRPPPPPFLNPSIFLNPDLKQIADPLEQDSGSGKYEMPACRPDKPLLLTLSHQFSNGGTAASLHTLTTVFTPPPPRHRPTSPSHQNQIYPSSLDHKDGTV
jgi:hypothetical protein